MKRHAQLSCIDKTTCFNCDTSVTSLWRRDQSGNSVCNACALYYKLHRTQRPSTMKKSVIQRRKKRPLFPRTATTTKKDSTPSANPPPTHQPICSLSTSSKPTLTIDAPFDSHRHFVLHELTTLLSPSSSTRSCCSPLTPVASLSTLKYKISDECQQLRQILKVKKDALQEEIKQMDTLLNIMHHHFPSNP